MARSQRARMKRQGVNSSGQRRPQNTVRPTVSGTNTVGQVLTGTNGTFSSQNTGTVTVTRQWLRNGRPITGATAATYTLVADDSGKSIVFRNIATTRFTRHYADSLPRTIA